MIRIICFVLLVALALAPQTWAAEPEDKDAMILLLRKALAEEKLERLRLEYLLTKSAHEQVMADIEAKEKSKKDKTDEKKP